MATKKPKAHKHSKSLIVLVIVLSILTIGLFINTLITTYLFKKDRQQDNQRVANLILDAVENLSQPLLKDPSGKQFIPEAKLALPATDPSVGEVAYNYSPASDGITERLNIASKRSINLAEIPLRNSGQDKIEDVFESVPKLQACARGVQVTFAAEDGYEYQATKQLANGKTAYFFMEDGCKNNELLAFVQRIDSY
jgi:hypothetical protein